MGAPQTRYCLEQDDNGHWYVIPVGKLDAFHDWLWLSLTGDDDCSTPAWAQRVVGGAPSLVTFTDFRIE